MSSILKALKKLEEEKVRNTEGTIDIGRDILRRHPRKNSSPWRWPVTTAGITLFVAGSIFIYTTSQLGTIEERTEEINTRAVTQTQPSGKSLVNIGRDVPSDEKKSPKRQPSPLPVEMSPPPQTPTHRGEALKTQFSRSTVSDGSTSALPLPRLEVTGIALQEDRTSSLAIVNDLPVMEGTFVEGALIEEIFNDRIRFSFNDKTFDIFLDIKRGE